MDYVADLKNLENYYANTLIVQYHSKPKATATIRMLVNLILAKLLIFQIQNGFDWKTAVGVQLDIIGQWVGVTRFFNGQLFEFRPWFALIDWDKDGDNLQGGYSNYDNFDSLEGGFLDYDNISPTQTKLNDTAYRMLIGLKIIYNSIKHTAKPIDNAIWDYFNGEVYTVWEDYKLVYYYPQSLREILTIAQDKGILPCPTGCALELREIIE